MRFDVVTIFPNMFVSPFADGVIKRAVDKGIVEIRCHDIRSHAADRHRTVDDTPYGGGPGMVLRPEPLARAIEAVPVIDGRRSVVLLTPRGEKLTQQAVRELSTYDQLVLICGRYEGIDERIVELFVEREVSIGDYVLSGGELPAMVVIESVARLIPGVLGNEESLREESHEGGVLEYPQYTRPAEFRGLKVPDVLLSGNHEEIRKWRLGKTKKK